MKANTELLLEDTFYHIYNRGINGETIFKKEGDYNLFLEKYSFHLHPFIDTYAYCLLSNHFHFLIKVKSKEEILEGIELKYPNKKVESISHFISKQFAHLFNGYSQIINKYNSRTGGLFESPFRRIEVTSDSYFSNLVWYIHHNPQKHGYVANFRDYPHSSYYGHLLTNTTKLMRKEVINWFGNKEAYQKFHEINNGENNIKNYVIEV